jgi:hypothetical protein
MPAPTLYILEGIISGIVMSSKGLPCCKDDDNPPSSIDFVLI